MEMTELYDTGGKIYLHSETVRFMGRKSVTT